MSSSSSSERGSLAYLTAILGSFLVMGILVAAMRHYVKVPAAGEDRVAIRSKALAELRAEEAQALNQAGWLDQTKGLVRLPIGTAMGLVEKSWQNPAAARSNLISRVEKAYYVPPPPANPFE
jgi:hypothetical protein